MDLEELLNRLYSEPDLEKRKYIPDKLAKLGDWRSTHPLGKLIVDDNQPDIMRNEAVESLGKQGDPEAILYLTQVLDDEDDDIRRTAVWSLGQIGVSETLDPVFSMKGDPNIEVRRWVAKSAGRIRNDDVISELIQYMEETPVSSARVIADIIRAISSQHHRLGPKDIEYWNAKGYELLGTDLPNYVKQAVMIMMNHLFSKNVSPDISFLIDLFNQLPERDPLVRPLIIEAMGHAEHLSFLHELQNSFAIKALGLAGDVDGLASVLSSNPSEEYIIAALEGYTHTSTTPDLDPFYDHSNLTIQSLALELHALAGLPMEKVVSAYHENQGKFKMLEILRYYKGDALDLYAESALDDEKVARQTTVYSLISPEMIEHKELHGKIQPILEKVTKQDTIWHIRRDARIGLEYIHNS